MPKIKVTFHFDTITEEIDRDDIIEHLEESEVEDFDGTPLDQCNDDTLLSLLMENALDLFYTDHDFIEPDAIRCEVAE